MERIGGASDPRKVCMNVRCGKSIGTSHKDGWIVRSGRPCELCEPCGTIYEQGRFCEAFHYDDAGWRTCNSCKKRVHCGCIVSMYSFVLLDTGGVECQACSKNGLSAASAMVSPLKGVQHIALGGIRMQLDAPGGAVPAAWGCEPFGSRVVRAGDLGSPWRQYSLAFHTPGSKNGAGGGPLSATQQPHAEVMLRNAAASGPDGKVIGDASASTRGGGGVESILGNDEKNFAKNTSTECLGDSLGDDPHHFTKNISSPGAAAGQDLTAGHALAATGNDGQFAMQAQQQGVAGGPSTGLSMGIGAAASKKGGLLEESTQRQSVALPAGLSGESKDLLSKISTSSSSAHRSRQRQLLPRPVPPSTPQSHNASNDAEAQGGSDPSVRVARPPGQGRGRNQLLPRYWPRITDQELQQITSGDSNSTITPLFEKMLSASDAGRIGRLVLPKACAEAYFPPISQPEGLPMKIQDITGKEWIFQFRFWPNNNSRMYVLEGVTPCIQSMQLQAGDTVTFSRLEPEHKLVMGYRRAPASLTTQVDRKRGRPLGGKSKRLRMDNEDSVELKTSWEEAQELLRPPHNAVPTIVTIETHEFEEYEEPPILSKKTFFVPRVSGEQDQWAQCDDCGNWRRLPRDAVVPIKWACSDNSWDLKRASCSVAQEVSNDDVEHMLGLIGGEDYAAPEKSDSPAITRVPNSTAETSGGLDALANAAALGDSCPRGGGASPSSPARTTKHPRHRPGCSCIVCIQPPSGKGPKHKQNCLCNVCVTVKRRFKTLMLRRKKRLSERETDGFGAVIRRKRKDDGEVSSGHTKVASIVSGRLHATAAKGLKPSPTDASRNAKSLGAGGDKKEASPVIFRTSIGKAKGTGDISSAAAEVGKGEIDLNSQPDKEEVGRASVSLVQQQQLPASQMSMRQLLQNASMPLDTYLKQTGMKSLLAGSGAEEESGVVAGESSAVGGRQDGGGASSSEKKSDEHSSSHCQDHSLEEASQTSAVRVTGDVASNMQV